MIRYYKNTLEEFFKDIQELNKSPYKNVDLCFSIQERLITKICYIEKCIKKYKREIRNWKKLLKSRKNLSGSNINSKELKNSISGLINKVKSYQNINYILHVVGDSIAYIYIDRWDIKPFQFKESAGFLSGKKGFESELKCFRYCYKVNCIAILNDLTNCLRHGDLTLIKKDSFKIIEIKSGWVSNKRTVRQQENLEHILKYLESDYTDNLYDSSIPCKRISYSTEPRYYVNELNNLIIHSKMSGSAYEEIEQGIIYYVANKFNKNDIDDIMKRFTEAPSVFILNKYKYKFFGYYPLPLIIKEPHSLYEFYTNTLIIIIFIDTVCINQFSQDSYKGKDSQDNINDDSSVLIPLDLLNRIFFDFLSLDWVLKQLLHIKKQKINENSFKKIIS